ncbi:MAG: DUF3606 domain-containing protein [Usitatibacter sp.]
MTTICFRENNVGEKARDTRIIEFENPDEVKYWMKLLDTSKDELFAAISAVGNSAHDVSAYLKAKFAKK